mmetsp:Transcript_7149/g.16375  ORF Transcript_7149/g.16375 Transcript_7149/m.16375 type:complete len:101 (+) Transcript_7149:912-1214(+)|eukprot:753643-Hanusia_phi.AAC.3
MVPGAGEKGFPGGSLILPQGALVAQLVAQKYPDRISQLVLYGSIFDQDVVYSPPSQEDYEQPPPHIANTMEGAMEDWTVAPTAASPARLDVGRAGPRDHR